MTGRDHLSTKADLDVDNRFAASFALKIHLSDFLFVGVSEEIGVAEVKEIVGVEVEKIGFDFVIFIARTEMRHLALLHDVPSSGH
jgi:hypothetical protein